MKCSYEILINDFTKYINKTLRKDFRVENWSFFIEYEDKHYFYVCIDYMNNFHSRDIFFIISTKSLDDLKTEFKYYLNKHLLELEGLIGE